MTTKPMLLFSIDPELLEQVDAFRYQHRFPARSQAIKYLLAWALKQKPVPDAADRKLQQRRKPQPHAKTRR